MAGSVYGRIATVGRFTCGFKPPPYVPESMTEDVQTEARPFEIGSVLQLSTQRGKEGEAAVDDLILCLPQPRAYRLAQHRQRLEGLLLQQIDGPLLQLPWEVDHPKDPGSRWRLQQQQQQEMRRPVSEGRRAIEEFGCPEDEEANDAVNNSGTSTSSGGLFHDVTRGEFARPMRSLPLAGRSLSGTEDRTSRQLAGGTQERPGSSELLDEFDLLRKRQAPPQPHPLSTPELEPIVITPAVEGDDGGAEIGHVQDSFLGRRRRRSRPPLHANSHEGTSRGQEEIEQEEPESREGYHEPWSLVGSREEWAERVVRENEALMERWRGRSRQRVSDANRHPSQETAGGRRPRSEQRITISQSITTCIDQARKPNYSANVLCLHTLVPFRKRLMPSSSDFSAPQQWRPSSSAGRPFKSRR